MSVECREHTFIIIVTTQNWCRLLALTVVLQPLCWGCNHFSQVLTILFQYDLNGSLAPLQTLNDILKCYFKDIFAMLHS